MEVEQEPNVNFKRIDNIEKFMAFLEDNGVILTEEHLRECFKELIENTEKI